MSEADSEEASRIAWLFFPQRSRKTLNTEELGFDAGLL